MAGNWIILENDGEGRPINLDYVIDIQLGADWPSATADQKKTLFVYQAVQTNAAVSGKYLPQYAASKYDSEALARAAFNRIIKALNRLNYIQDDLRSPTKTTLVASSAVTATAGVDNQVIRLTGTGFNNTGSITLADSSGVNSVAMPVGVVPDSNGTLCQFVLDTSITAGTYNIEYTDTDGNAAVLKNGIVIS